MVKTAVDRLVQSVEDARLEYLCWAPETCEFPETVHMGGGDCEFAARMIDAASVALDVAMAAASDARRGLR